MDILSESFELLRTNLKIFACKLKQWWIQSQYTESLLFKRSEEWLELDFSDPNSVILILIHGTDIIQHALLSID